MPRVVGVSRFDVEALVSWKVFLKNTITILEGLVFRLFNSVLKGKVIESLQLRNQWLDE